MKKLEIKWSLISESKCEGIATVFDYYEGSCTGKVGALQSRIAVGQGYISSSPAYPNEYLPCISGEERGIIHTMATSFFSGARKHNSCFHWLHTVERRPEGQTPTVGGMVKSIPATDSTNKIGMQTYNQREGLHLFIGRRIEVKGKKFLDSRSVHLTRADARNLIEEIKRRLF